ncbi:MAG TPA: hypothetical protein VJ917_10970 [Saprospiraceae bacterium]|nr:hypothetical protein [Saprospiraceae bacterium]
MRNDKQKNRGTLPPEFFNSMRVLSFSLLFFISCGEKDISGTWTGLSLYENGHLMDNSKAELCSLYIDENGAYFFRGNTGLIEKGLLSQKKNLLYMQDTLREQPTKQIAYDLIGQDTLELLMNDQSNALRLTMKKEKN